MECEYFTFDKYITNNKEGTKSLLKLITQKGERSQIVSGTGTGKGTFIFGEEKSDFPNIVKELQNNYETKHFNIVVITPITALTINTHSRCKHLGFRLVAEGSENARTMSLKEESNIIVSTYRQAPHIHQRLLDKDTVYIIDELPEVINAQYQNIPELERILNIENPNNIIIGLTATPYKEVFEDLWGFKTYNLKNNSQNKPKLHIYRAKNRDVIDTIETICDGKKRQVLVFANNVNMTEHLTDKLKNKGINASHIHSQLNKEEKTKHKDIESINKTKTLESDILSATSFISIGVDIKDCDVIYYASSAVGNDISHFLQAIARSRNIKDAYIILQDSKSRNKPKFNTKNFKIEKALDESIDQKKIAEHLNNCKKEISKIDIGGGERLKYIVASNDDTNNTIYLSTTGEYKTSILTSLKRQKDQIVKSLSNDEYQKALIESENFSGIEIKESTKETKETKLQKQLKREEKELRECFIKESIYKCIDEEYNVFMIDLLCEYIYHNDSSKPLRDKIMKSNDHLSRLSFETKGRLKKSRWLEKLIEEDLEWLERDRNLIKGVIKTYCEVQAITNNNASKETIKAVIEANTTRKATIIKALKTEVRMLIENTIEDVTDIRVIIPRYEHKETLFLNKVFSHLHIYNEYTYTEVKDVYRKAQIELKHKPFKTDLGTFDKRIIDHLKTKHKIEVDKKNKKIKILQQRRELDKETSDKISKNLSTYKRVNKQRNKTEKQVKKMPVEYLLKFA